MIPGLLGVLFAILLTLSPADASDRKAELLKRSNVTAATTEGLRSETAAIRHLVAANREMSGRVIGPRDDIAAAFEASRAGETLIVRGHHRITQALSLKDRQTVYLDGATLDGSILLDPAKWTRSGRFWRQPIPNAQGDGKCYCGKQGEPLYVDFERNPLAAEREKLLVDGRFIFELPADRSRTPDGSTKWWRHEEGQAVINFDPAGHVIEVTHAQHVFRGDMNGVRILSDSPERGVIRGAASPTHLGMIESSADVGMTIESVTIEDSASIGVRPRCGFLRNVVLRENAQAGMVGPGRTCAFPEAARHGKWFNSLIDSEVYDNNVLLFREEWEAGGIKMGLGIKKCRLAGNRVWGNHGTALWVDNTGGGSCVLENNLIWANARSALHAEYQAIQPGHDYGFLARNNIVVDNAPEGSYRCNKAALMVRKSPDAAFLDNLIVLTGQANGFCLKHGAKADLDDEWFPHRNLVQGNTFVFLPGNTKSFNGPWADRSEGTWRDFGARIDGNRYVVQAGQSTALWLLDESRARTDAGNERRLTWSAWRERTGFDRNSELMVVEDVLAWLKANHPEAAALLP